MNSEIGNKENQLVTIINGKELVYSKSIVISKDKNEVLIKNPFDLTIVFSLEKEKNEKGEVKASTKVKVDDGLRIEIVNAFYMNGSFIESASSTGFCEMVRERKDGVSIDNYFLTVLTSSVSVKEDYLVANVNIFKKTREIKTTNKEQNND